MVTRRSLKSATVAVKSAELAMAVPQVVAHRVARMALAGPSPSDRDRREFQLMVSEKQAAFSQAWSAMAMESIRANQTITASMFAAFFNPFSRNKPSVAALATTVQNAAVGVLAKGLAPVHRKAVSNAKRLARTKPR
ncbi:MAG TPA: polyhydroxyalkanoate granule-associated phasin [Lamprocystis sp. (in: g-proteobacteria)]|nr:polyhydroxyalkanoate granule-associated phasin [Lamprocystis sp. (in: g-proteobacteria)]